MNIDMTYWPESAMELHVFPIPISPPTSLSTRFLWVFQVHQARALVIFHLLNQIVQCLLYYLE